MKRSHKLQTLGDVQAIVNAAPDLGVAAQRLGINRSTLTRWMQSGKVQRPSSVPAVEAVTVPATAEGWKAGVLAGHVLSETEQAIVDIADVALRLARDPETAAFTKLTAMGRFAALVKQLNLDAKRIDAVKAPEQPKAAARRPGIDPRGILMAAK